MYFIPELVQLVKEKNDTLQAVGWNVINHLPISHKPHLSYLYFKKDIQSIPVCAHHFPDSISDWDLYIADTRDEDYSKWKIIEI